MPQVGGVVSAGGFTVTATLVVCNSDPEIPVTTTVLFPVVADPGPTLNVLVQELPEAGVHENPEGHEQERLVESQFAGTERDTAAANPFRLVTVMVTFWDDPP